MKKIVGLAAIVTLMSGCATRPPAVELMNLAVVTGPPKSFIFPRSIPTFFKSQSWAVKDVEDTTLAGLYTATHENELGTFYEAKHYSIGARHEPKGRYMAFRGGFWIPKAEGVAPKKFVFAAPPDLIDDITSVNGTSSDGTSAVIANVVGGMGGSPMASGIGGGIAAGIIGLAGSNPTRVLSGISDQEVLASLQQALQEAK